MRFSLGSILVHCTLLHQFTCVEIWTLIYAGTVMVDAAFFKEWLSRLTAENWKLGSLRHQKYCYCFSMRKGALKIRSVDRPDTQTFEHLRLDLFLFCGLMQTPNANSKWLIKVSSQYLA